MGKRLLLKILSFGAGTLVSMGITAVTFYLIFAYTVKGFDYGRGLTTSLTSEKEVQEITVAIPDGASLEEVAKLLEKEGVIENALLYRLECKLKGAPKVFEGGDFVVNTAMSTSELNKALHKQEVSTDIKITILEGFTAADIGQYLEDKEIITAAEFLEGCNTLEFNYSFVKDLPQREGNRLEGYLFPDTYFISQKADAKEIINKMLARFEQIYTREYQTKAEALGLTTDQVVAMASIIEKEVNISAERPKVSAVIHNRLNKDMNLQMCSTVVFVLDKRRDRLSEADLGVASPYNTYNNKGLPVGPICSPGQACIEAALNPADSGDLYFVLKDNETGEHIFTDNYDAFKEAKAQYKQIY